MRALVLLTLGLAICVNAGLSAGLLDLKSSAGTVKGIIKEKVIDKIEQAADRIKEAFKNDMASFKKRLSGFRDKILKKLALTKEQRVALLERLKLFKRKSIDKVQPMGDSIEEINRNSKIAGALFQGDMILSKDQEDQIIAEISDGARSKRQAMKETEYPGKRWHQGVNYFFDSKFSTPEIKSVFKKAAELWMNNTCIDLREEKYARDTVRVYKGEGCFSFFGRIGATQSLSLGPGCETVGTAAHEIGHALGFYHTHSRYDRDEFITVDVANIKREWADQFVLKTIENNYNYDLTYDWGSIMHYGATSAAMNGKPTMVPKDVLYTETLGSPFIGYYDLLMINKHYNCTDVCKNKPSSCKNHGFPNPRDCNKCICPGGYGGPQCDRRPDGCGEELVATGKWQQLKDQLGEAGDSAREDFMKCHYWIKAPAGKKVQVKLVSFSKGVATDGCIYAGVEIKTHPDQRLTGYRFCSEDDKDTILNSTSNLVPVMTYNRKGTTHTTLEYRYI